MSTSYLLKSLCQRVVLRGPFFVCTFFVCSWAAIAQPQLLTFDDLATPYDGYEYRAPMTTYGGLQWFNFYVFDATDSLHYQNSGYPAGLVSGKNLAFNWFGNPAHFSSSTPFNLNSAYLTAAWNIGLNVEVRGYTGSTLAYDQSVVIGTSGPTFVTFDLVGVTEVDFISSGGTPDPRFVGTGAGTHFAVDNLNVTTVPEPGPAILALLGCALAVARKTRTAFCS
jgi:hypothetical protein